MGSDRAVRAPLVAICMATFEPEPALLARQVDSIVRQTHERFVCIVIDDASGAGTFGAVEAACAGDGRFVFRRNRERLGFYRNFERSLSLVPSEAAFVALSDQDDVWHADKLETLLGAVEDEGALLAYSDMRIVAPDGRIVAPSYWTDRRNNWTSLESLLLANTVTGAASLFCRALLDDALPFPDARGAFHDHWLACVALSLGRIAYVPRPLYDYVQHAANVVGSHVPPDQRGGLVNAIGRFARQPIRRTRSTIAHARGYYEDGVRPRETFARELDSRLDGRIAPEKAADVRRVARLDSPGSLARLLVRSARDLRGDTETAGIELQLAKGVVWHWQDEARARLGYALARR